MENFKREGIPIVCDLDLKRYLGNWYEIGRLPLKSEKDMENITAIYNLKKNGKVEVVNSGFIKGKKKGIRGTAWIRDKKCTGGLFVRFFWPFKSEYNVIKIEKDYRYAVVMGNTRDSLWILNRNPKMEKEVYEEIVQFLDEKGFDISKIINSKQNKN